MVREKKMQALPLEEKLAQALVPESEQAYEVPNNWVWTNLGAINNYQGVSIDPGKKPNQFFELYSVPSSENNYPEIIIGSEIASTKQSVAKDDVLLCKINPRINRVWRVYHHTDYPLIASSEWIVIRSDDINSKYLQLCLSTKYFRELLLSNVSGVGGSLMRAQPKYVKTYPIPLPPLAEQQRIVTQIECLFEKLDRARELVQQALDSFETRKAAILHKAFTGELTVEWRAKNDVGSDSWKEKPLKDICENISCGGTPTDNITDEGDIPFLKVYNIVNNAVDFAYKPQFIDKGTHEKKLKKSQLMPNDVIMNIVGPPLRKIAIVPDNYPEWNMNQAIVRFRPLEKLYYRYLYYCLCYPATLDSVISNTKGVVGQANISITQSRDLTIPLPSLPEQQEIVRILDNLLEKEQQAKDKLEPILEQIDMMKKSILARAFRGELGTNDPCEESALELLKQVLS